MSPQTVTQPLLSPSPVLPELHEGGAQDGKLPQFGIIVGSTRPGRKAEQVAHWVHHVAARRDDARFEVLDLADFAVPMLDEPMPPMRGEVAHGHTRAWAAAVEHLRTIVGELKVADVRSQVGLSLSVIDGNGVHADARAQARLSTMLGEIVVWSGALRGLRAVDGAV